MTRSGGSDGKESACNEGDPGLILGEGKSPGEGNGNPLQYSGLENPMDGGAWWATVYGVTDQDLTDPWDPGRSCGLRVLPAANTSAIRHFYTKPGFACVWQDSPGVESLLTSTVISDSIWGRYWIVPLWRTATLSPDLLYFWKCELPSPVLCRVLL